MEKARLIPSIALQIHSARLELLSLGSVHTPETAP